MPLAVAILACDAMQTLIPCNSTGPDLAEPSDCDKGLRNVWTLAILGFFVPLTVNRRLSLSAHFGFTG